jgi:acyl-CoA reductase-like NAD-dependent aldehyde dehydrogenase
MPLNPLRRPGSRPSNARSGRVQTFDSPPATNPWTGRPFGETASPQVDERAAAEIAAGQLALAAARGPGEERARLLAEAAKNPAAFRSPLHPTRDDLARRVTIRRGGTR